ncbi:PDGF- and VEGF-receptor related isoform X3 [Choristoneura fumiferana]|uniref:PDGF- and VEGF-receptor related isoform X3 n=1 Tax=Choristoneura fumiferana TaxID=7141 RepID=UPI003D154B8B
MIDLWGWCLLAALLIPSDAQLLDGPIILAPNEIKLEKGQNYTIRCKGKRPLQFKQQEMAEENFSSFSKTLRNVAPSDDEYEFEIALDIYNVDQFAVGYFACFDDQVDKSEVLTNLLKEPTNTEHISYTYVFVNDPNNLIAPMREFLSAIPGSKIVIECKPTYPDIKVHLTLKPQPAVNKKLQILENSTKIGFLIKVHNKGHTYVCEGRRGIQTSTKTAFLNFRFNNSLDMDSPDKPTIDAKNTYFLRDETILLNCTVNYKPNTAISLEWSIPRGNFSGVDISSNEKELLHDKLYKAISVKNATKDDAGPYWCTAKTKINDNPPSSKITMNFSETPFLKLTNGSESDITTGQGEFSFLFNLKAYPPATYRFYKDDNTTITHGLKYKITKTGKGNPKLTVEHLNIHDTGKYTIEASNANGTKTLTYNLKVYDIPRIQFDIPKDRKLVGTIVTLRCVVTGYPIPKVVWSFIDDDTNELSKHTGEDQELKYKVISTLKMSVNRSGTIRCGASNTINSSFVSQIFRVNEIADGFGVPDGEYIDGEKHKWVYENQDVNIKCFASKYSFSSVNWLLGSDYSELPYNMVGYYNTSLSFVAELKIEKITLSQAGNYICVGYNQTYEPVQNETVFITVAVPYPPNIKVPVLDTETKEVMYGQPTELLCVADSVPPPEITWFKNGEQLKDNITVLESNHTTVNSTYTFKKEDDGTTADEYECIAKSRDTRFHSGVESRKTYIVNIKTFSPHSPYRTAYLTAFGVLMLALIILVVYLTWKIRKERQFRKDLAAAGLLYFKEGATKSLNPELGIDEQAELLPYDDKFEFPAEKLTLGAQLGAGAFGVVYKAEARGMSNAEDTTTVAVKMVKKTADNIYIKALASELKIMVHLGKHINIVNLLGACTKNVGKRELIVIVEYCKFGNIHNYMQRHREVFIDQLTDNKEKNQGNINRGFSCSSGNSGMDSDCLSSNQTQETDHTFLNTAASNRSGRTVSETGYVQPEWRSNYESDYVSDGRKPRPLYSRDLLAWAFQIARGMEYLASRKILHGDLAARNILLAEDNVVKICDFGLARSIYKNDEYQKKENSPLPVKWLALECMTDRIFSTQSDVWSFGIVLWELFSLAKTPYPEISPQNLLPRLLEGHRLDKPKYADDRLYKVMRSCWEQRPGKRPTFSELQETIGSFLEDNVRNHYVELNAPCADQNADRTGEDYLVRVCAPDYNNQVTPSPHHYANDANGFFFGVNPNPSTIPLQHDDEGYLAMTPAPNSTIFSPRLGPAFDFDPRNLNPRVSAASQGSELTPMLTLNHLSARSGSESDQEGNASPYLNMYPRIDEETDEVFEKEMKNNIKNSQNNAVTNPTYISFPSLDKKSPIIANNYVNLNGNGLVK